MRIATTNDMNNGATTKTTMAQWSNHQIYNGPMEQSPKTTKSDTHTHTGLIRKSRLKHPHTTHIAYSIESLINETAIVFIT